MNWMLHLPSLSILRSFEAAAKHQSFTLAAEELHVTQGAISRQVRELEGLVGVALFCKAGRGVSLTEAGRIFAARLHGDLDRLRQTVIETQAAGEGAQTLSIAVLPTFGSRWLVPRLPRFCAQHPEIQIALHSRPVPFDLTKESIDIAIHYGSSEWVGGDLTELCPEDLVLVASPALLDKYDIRQPAEAIDAPLLHLSSRHAALPTYFRSLGVDDGRTLQGAMFDQFSMLISAAVHGMGTGIVPTYLIESELAQGTLVAIDYQVGSQGKYYLVRPQNTSVSAAEYFANWVTSEARTSIYNRSIRLKQASSSY
ncbi:MAG: LysR substrate-binding domain-containing protein [Pseudorhodobacter sp.]